ncbi:MAG: formylglycine-generating enzyme family protein [Acidobacteria bacterium]|nr:formylglycine-generating enzyme family protein [Acidobacteriota bacterium]
MKRAVCLLLGAAFAAEPGMVFIPGGKFTRGRTYVDTDSEAVFYPNPLKDDLPARELELSPFYLDEHEVTISEYAAFTKATQHRTPPVWRDGRPPKGKENHPVAEVSWDDATAYCKWRGKRLPTEAEFERACRGSAEKQKYPWGDKAPVEKQARFNTLEGPANVCAAAKSPSGVCDICGNVWEWTGDWYGRDYYKEAPEKDPPGPASGIYRVLRGGSWFDAANFLACSYRSWARQAERSPTIGFRCATNFKRR